MMKKNLVIISAVVLGVLLVAGIAFAQTKKLRKVGHERHLAFMTVALDLTDAQVQQVKQIHAAEQPKYEAFRRDLKNAMEDMKPLIATDNFDEAKVRAAITQRQQVMQDMMVTHAREMNAVYKILTPEQRTKAVKMFDHFGKFGHGRHGGRFHHDSAPEAPAPAN